MLKNIGSQLMREIVAEFVGTTFLMSMGIGSCCTFALNDGSSSNVLVVFGWGLTVAFAIILTGGVSGAHLNPAISLTFGLFGQLPWIKVLFYILAQFFGAFFGSAIAFGIYYDALNAFDNGMRVVQGANATAGLFATYPQEYLSTIGGFANEVFATGILMLCVMGISDKKNFKLPSFLTPLFVGFLVILLSCTYCSNSGCAMNPARDLGPRLFTSVAGWGLDVFSFRNYNWFWVPIVGPICGAPLGVMLYKLCFDFNFSCESTYNSDKSIELSVDSEEFVDKQKSCSLFIVRKFFL